MDSQSEHMPHMPERPEEIHPAFSVTIGGPWAWNKNPGNCKETVDRKTLFQFGKDNLGNLDDCPAVAKIGFNTEGEGSDLPYIGFAYGNRDNEDEIVTFAKRFPKSKLITNLNDTWGSSPRSEETDL